MGLLTPFPGNDDPATANIMAAMPTNELFIKNDKGLLQGTGVTMAQLKTMAGNVQTSLVGADGKIEAHYLPDPPEIAQVGYSGEYADLLGTPALSRVALTGSYNDLTDRPALFSGAWADLTGRPGLFSGAWADLTGVPAFKRVATTADYNDLLNTPVLFSGRWQDVTGRPVFAAVATSGDYNDLTNRPALFDGSWDSLRNKPVLFSGAWSDLSGRPTIPAAQQPADWLAASGPTSIQNKPALFSGDYNDLKNLPTLSAGQVQSDWNATAGPALILNKPAIPSAQQPADWNAVDGPTAVLNKPVLFSGRWADIAGKPGFAAVATTGAYNDLTGKPALFDGTWGSLTGKPDIPAAQVQADWNATSGMAVIKNKPALFDGTWQSLLNKPALAAVATTGRFADLTDAPAIPAAPVNADWTATTGLARVLNKPTTLAGYGITDAVTSSALTTSLQSKMNTPAGTSAQYVRGDGSLATLPVMSKVIETLAGATSTTAGPTLGVVDFVFTQTYANVPQVNPVLINAAAGVMLTVTNVTNKGCRVSCFQRNAVTLLGVEVLLAATVPVGGVSVGLLVVSRD